MEMAAIFFTVGCICLAIFFFTELEHPPFIIVGLLLIICSVLYAIIKDSEEQHANPTITPITLKAINVDSMRKAYFNEGYRRGQIDCQNDSIVWRKVMNDDGEVIYQHIK